MFLSIIINPDGRLRVSISRSSIQPPGFNPPQPLSKNSIPVRSNLFRYSLILSVFCDKYSIDDFFVRRYPFNYHSNPTKYIQEEKDEKEINAI